MTYDADLAAIHAARFTDTARAAARQLIELLPPGSRVVELGCGDGTTAELLSAAGHGVHGIDQSAAMIELARFAPALRRGGLLLHRPADVLRRLRVAGFTARTLRGGYAGTPLPADCTAYLARRR